MTDSAAFLRAIRLHPEETTPRLVFADWLDEHIADGEGFWLRWAAQNRLAPVPSDTGKTFCWWLEVEGSEFVHLWGLPFDLFDQLAATHQRQGHLQFVRYRSVAAAMTDLYHACRSAPVPAELLAEERA